MTRSITPRGIEAVGRMERLPRVRPFCPYAWQALWNQMQGWYADAPAEAPPPTKIAWLDDTRRIARCVWQVGARAVEVRVFATYGSKLEWEVDATEDGREVTLPGGAVSALRWVMEEQP